MGLHALVLGLGIQTKMQLGIMNVLKTNGIVPKPIRKPFYSLGLDTANGAGKY